MFDKVLSIVAPHYCYVCRESGTTLCESCIENISMDESGLCLVCLSPSIYSLCKNCLNTSTFSAGWYVGKREDELKRLIDDFKFRRTNEVHSALAKLLDRKLPVLPSGTVVVPIPTIAPHKRVRGYGHTELFAKKFASLRKLTYKESIGRLTNSIQVGSSRQTREIQAKKAFYYRTSNIELTRPHLIVDDIYTTGSTMHSAVNCLRDAGVQQIWIAVIARQNIN